MTLSVVIPVYNEEQTIGQVLDKIRGVPVNKEVIIVDDGSTDHTREILRDRKATNSEIKIVHHSVINIGKGAAVRIGIHQAVGDIILIQDADLELDPTEYPQLVAPILEGRAKIVYGSRFMKRQPMPWLTRFSNRLLVHLTNLLYGTKLSDMETAYKVFHADILRRIKLKSFGFEFEAEVTAKAARLGYTIHEVPISYSPRTIQDGKKVNWLDGIKAILMLIKVRVAPISDIAMER